MRVAVLCILLVSSSVAFAQEAGNSEEELVEIELDPELKLADFLDYVGVTTGAPILFDPDNQRIRNQTIGAGFSAKVPKTRVFDTFRAILAFYELTLTPVGPAGYEVWLVLDSRSTNNLVKSRAVTVAYENLARYADREGLYIRCAIPVKHLRNLTSLRTALAVQVSPAGIGRVMEVPESGFLLVQDFAPNVASIAELVRLADRPREDDDALEYDVIRLGHADARELADMLRHLLAPVDGGEGKAKQPAAPAPPDPRILAYARLNALAVAATPERMKTLRDLVALLDVPPGMTSR